MAIIQWSVTSYLTYVILTSMSRIFLLYIKGSTIVQIDNVIISINTSTPTIDITCQSFIV
jgi:hypothetical protein